MRRQFASVVIQDSEGRILLVRETKPLTAGKFNLPGGHVEEGEDPLQCVIREVAEETGLHVHPGTMLDEYEFHAGINLVFLATVRDAPMTSAGEIPWGWHSLDEIRQIADADILNPMKFRKIVSDLELGRQRPL